MQVIDDPYNGNIFGRLGKGLGQGLSDQLPKEVERSRLSAGLKSLEEQKDLDPMQFFSRALGVPGITPQMVQSLAELSKQRLKNNAYSNVTDEASPENQLKNFGYSNNNQNQTEDSTIPSVTTNQALEAARTPFIPRSFKEQEIAGADQFKKNPAKYKNDIQNAINEQISIDEAEERRNTAFQKQRENENSIQNAVRTGLSGQHKLLQNNVPARIYSLIEDEAINSVLPKSQGGRGFTEHQAAKEYGEKLQEISKDFSDVASLGKLGNSFKTAKTNMKTINQVVKKVIDYDGQEEFAKFLQSQNGLSPNASYEIAYPVWSNPKMDDFVKKAPPLPPYGPYPKGNLSLNGYTNRLLPELEKIISKNDGPIAIAKALGKKGYDEDTIMKYFTENADKLFTVQQARQLTSSQSYLPNLNDLFISSLIGKEI